MKKKLSAYWWCQVGGWGFFILIAAGLYFSHSGFAHFPSFVSILMTGLLGLLSSHLMRLFIIKMKLLHLKIWKQFVFMFLTAILFSFIYYIFQSLENVLLTPEKFTFDYNLHDVVIGTFISFNFLIIWILIYFSYHYIKSSRYDQVERVRAEANLKIQQLESEKAQIEYQRNLGSYYLMALRYQMNPHFIFNCLNSIKLYIAQNDTASASDYLTKFSKLIRLVMEKFYYRQNLICFGYILTWKPCGLKKNFSIIFILKKT